MVRYPKKNSLYQPVEPVPLVKFVPLTDQKSPVVMSPSVQPAVVKAGPMQDAQVQELNEHIRILEEKLKAIETTVAAGRDSKERPLVKMASPVQLFRKYWIVLFLSCLAYPVFLGYNRWMHPSYIATMGFLVSPTEIKVPGAVVLVPKEFQENMLISDLTIGKAWSRAAHWPELIGKQPWVVRPIAWAYQKRITFDKYPSDNGFVVNVMENKMEKARGFAMAIVDVFKERYIAERGARLRSAIVDLNVKLNEHQKRLERIVTQLSAYRLQEQCIVVSAGIKKSLDATTTERALELEEDYARVKVQSQSFPLMDLEIKKGFSHIIFFGLVSRLTDMELKKYLVGKDAWSLYEGGMQSTKARIVSMINDLAASDASIDANLLIKAAFIKTRYDALDTLLNKRYGTASSFSGRTAEYAGLKAEFGKRYMSMEGLNNTKVQLSLKLQQDLSAEVVVDMPVIVVKR